VACGDAIEPRDCVRLSLLVELLHQFELLSLTLNEQGFELIDFAELAHAVGETK
jgi:hypothetical protein